MREERQSEKSTLFESGRKWTGSRCCSQVYNNSSKPQNISNFYIGMNEFYGGLGEAGPLWPGEEMGKHGNVYQKSV